MLDHSLKIVQEKFSEYYNSKASEILAPSLIEKREFGFLLFKEGFMLRHRKFQKIDDLRAFLISTVPSDVYYSSAFYENPEAEMEKKNWLGADLIFDIDADHIPTPCNKIHDSWICTKCGFQGRGITPKNCPSCGASRFHEKTWPCEICLETAKDETIKLLDILSKDFGFSAKEIVVAFSGHRGYHVHVESETIQSLDQMARKEIVDYVIGLGIDTSLYSLKEQKPSFSSPGWNERIFKGILEILFKTKPEELKNIGLKKKVVDSLLSNREALMKNWETKGFIIAIKGIGTESWKKIVEWSIKLQAAKIDTVVTTDIHRLIRLNNTLHGKTALKKVEFSISNIEGFDPFRSAVAFHKDAIKVAITEAPSFRIENETYGPYKNTKVELPTAAALFLLCKNVAEVVN
jgi:DNA primase small subunit